MALATSTMIAIGATAAVAGAGVSGYSAYQSGKSQEAMADYNAKIAENEAIARQQAVEAESRQLAKKQRAMKAQQRVSVGMRGGLQEGTDLLALAEQSEQMQLDQLELQRQQDIAGIRGASEAAMSRYKGSAASTAGKWLAGGSALQGISLGASGYAAYDKQKALEKK